MNYKSGVIMKDNLKSIFVGLLIVLPIIFVVFMFLIFGVNVWLFIFGIGAIIVFIGFCWMLGDIFRN